MTTLTNYFISLVRKCRLSDIVLSFKSTIRSFTPKINLMQKDFTPKINYHEQKTYINAQKQCSKQSKI